MGKEEKYVVIESHPNGGSLWVGKVGDEKEIRAYLKREIRHVLMGYIWNILELKKNGEIVNEKFLEIDEDTYEFIGTKE